MSRSRGRGSKPGRKQRDIDAAKTFARYCHEADEQDEKLKSIIRPHLPELMKKANPELSDEEAERRADDFLT